MAWAYCRASGTKFHIVSVNAAGKPLPTALCGFTRVAAGWPENSDHWPVLAGQGKVPEQFFSSYTAEQVEAEFCQKCARLRERSIAAIETAIEQWTIAVNGYRHYTEDGSDWSVAEHEMEDYAEAERILETRYEWLAEWLGKDLRD